MGSRKKNNTGQTPPLFKDWDKIEAAPTQENLTESAEQPIRKEPSTWRLDVRADAYLSAQQFCEVLHLDPKYYLALAAKILLHDMKNLITTYTRNNKWPWHRAQGPVRRICVKRASFTRAITHAKAITENQRNDFNELLVNRVAEYSINQGLVETVEKLVCKDLAKLCKKKKLSVT